MENERFSNRRFFIAGLKRALYSKSYIIHLAITFFMALLSISLLKAIQNTANILSKDIFETFRYKNTYNVGILSISQLDGQLNAGCDEIIKGILSGSFLICVVSTFVSMFVCNECRNGYLLFALTHGQKRSHLFNQYIITSIFATIPILITSLIGVIISLAVNTRLCIGNLSEIIIILYYQAEIIILCSICFSCISIVLQKNNAITVCISSVLIIPLLPRYFLILTKGKINIEPYIIFNILINSPDCKRNEMINGSFIAIITTIIIWIISKYIFQKRNIE